MFEYICTRVHDIVRRKNENRLTRSPLIGSGFSLETVFTIKVWFDKNVHVRRDRENNFCRNQTGQAIDNMCAQSGALLYTSHGHVLYYVTSSYNLTRIVVGATLTRVSIIRTCAIIWPFLIVRQNASFHVHVTLMCDDDGDGYGIRSREKRDAHTREPPSDRRQSCFFFLRVQATRENHA